MLPFILKTSEKRLQYGCEPRGLLFFAHPHTEQTEAEKKDRSIQSGSQPWGLFILLLPLRNAEAKEEHRRFCAFCNNKTAKKLWRLSTPIQNVLNNLQINFKELPQSQSWGSVTFWCGSIPMTNGSGSDLFLQWLQECKKIVFSHIFF